MFEVKIPEQAAREEVEKLLDKKTVMPRRRKQLHESIESVVEAVSLGFVAIGEDGTVTQTLIKPVAGLTKLVFKPHVPASAVQKELATLRNITNVTVNNVYLNLYTDTLQAQTDQLEPADRNTADSICFFCQ